MTAQANIVQPPRLATWLVNLFISAEGESIVGDLFEEFCLLASRSGVAFARRWYWRQAVKSIGHLIVAGFRGAPTSITAIVIAGFFLHGFVFRLPEKATIGTYRPIPRVLVDALRSLRVAPERDVRRAYRRLHVRWLYGRASGQGQGDGCRDDVGSCFFRIDRLCLGMDRHTWADQRHMDAMVLQRPADPGWRGHGPNAQVRCEASAFGGISCGRSLQNHSPAAETYSHFAVVARFEL